MTIPSVRRWSTLRHIKCSFWLLLMVHISDQTVDIHMTLPLWSSFFLQYFKCFLCKVCDSTRQPYRNQLIFCRQLWDMWNYRNSRVPGTENPTPFHFQEVEVRQKGLHPGTLTAGTWEYTPGRGKLSSKPPFSGSMLIFGGVLWLVIP